MCSTAAASICALASLYRQPGNALSFNALRQGTWRESGGCSVTEEALVDVFVNRPELIDSWLAYSEDQRSGEAWYFVHEPKTERGLDWVVGNLSMGAALRFGDRAVACAAFVARTVGEPYVERTSHQHGS